MKKQFFRTTAIKFYSTALITSMLVLGTLTSNAADKAETSSAAQITYIGSTNNLMGFNVNYENVAQENFTLELVDGQGRVLYTKKYSDKSFNKNIYLKNEGENVKVNFVIKAGKNTINQKFDIDSKVKVVEEVVVTKL
jgi:hypothetical protein